MNSQYVLTAFFDRDRVGFIMRERSGRIEDLIENAGENYSFKPLRDGQKGESTEWSEFSDALEYLIDDSIQQNWSTAPGIEFDRWSASPRKSSHEPLVQRIMTDKEYRAYILTDASSY